MSYALVPFEISNTVFQESPYRGQIRVPNHLVAVDPYFWTNQNHLDAKQINPDMSNEEYDDAFPLDGYAKGQIVALLENDQN